MRAGIRVVYSSARLASRVAQLGRSISRDYAGRTVDVVILMESAFVFSADLLRHISCPVVCHFVRVRMRDVTFGGHKRLEVFFNHPPELKGREVLLVDTVLQSGVTQDFLVKRLLESQPHSLRLAVLIDRPEDRKVDLKPDYFGFVAASKNLVGYGLPGSRGFFRNLPCVGLRSRAGRRTRAAAKRARTGGKKARPVR